MPPLGMPRGWLLCSQCVRQDSNFFRSDSQVASTGRTIFLSNIEILALSITDGWYTFKLPLTHSRHSRWSKKDILKGSLKKIGVGKEDGCGVVAGAVVSKKIPPYNVVAGVPAKRIKMRGE
jgi:hypothetical protein